MTTVESQLMVLGQAVTGGSTPKATLFELALFRRFSASSLLTESYGESVAFGALENEEDSNRDKRCQSLKPNHHGPHDSHHLADQLGPGYSGSDSAPAAHPVRAGYGHRERSAADRSCDGLGCAVEDVERLVSSAAFS